MNASPLPSLLPPRPAQSTRRITSRSSPLRSILIGKSRGRTIRALRERIDKLCASKDSRTEGLQLSKYHDLVLRAVSGVGDIAYTAST